MNIRTCLKSYAVASLALLVAGSFLFSGEAWAHGRSDAMMVYDTDDAATSPDYIPKYKVWDGAAWSSEQRANPVNGSIRHMVLKYAPTRNEAILAVLTNTGELQAQVFDGTSWGTVVVLDTITDGSGDATTQSLYRGFDLEYEITSGDAVIIYGDGTPDPDYQVWDGSDWSGAGDVNIPNTYIPNWIEMAADPGSDDLAMILVDGTGDIYGLRWDGTGWDNMGTSAVWDAVGSSIFTRKSLDVAYETNSGEIMFLWGTSNTTDDHRYKTYASGSLSVNGTRSNANAGGQPHWIKLEPNPLTSSNQIMLASLDAGADLNTFLWDGSSWSAAHTEHDGATENILDMNFDIAFETFTDNSSDAILVWGDGATVSRKLWGGSSWGTASTSGDDTAQVYITAQPNSGDLLAIMYEDSTSASDDITTMYQTDGVQTWSTPAKLWYGPTARRSGNFYVALASQSYNSSVAAMVVYDTQTTVNTPKYRQWTSNAWGDQSSVQPVEGPTRHLQLKFAPTRNEAILVTQNTSGIIQAQVWDGTGWNSPQNIGQVVDSNTVGNTQGAYRGFDLDYEQSSGEAVIVYGDGTPDPNYRVWDGSSWSSESNIDIPNLEPANWIETTANYGSDSDHLAMILVDGSSDVFGLRWDGTGWDSMGESAVWDSAAGSAIRKSVDVGFERNSGEILFIWADDVAATHWNYRTYSSGSLGAVTALTNTNNGGIGNWVNVAANPLSNSDQVMIGGEDAGNDFNTRLWDGSSWDAAAVEHAGTCEAAAEDCFDIGFEVTNQNVAWAVYGNGTNFSRRRWTGASWQAATTVGDDSANPDLEVHPVTGAVLVIVYEDSTSASDDITEMHISDGSSTWPSPAIIWSGPVRATDGLNVVSIAAEQYYVDFTQNDFEFFVDDTTVSLGNAWPPGVGSDVEENTALTQLPATNLPLSSGDKIRLQMNFGIAKRDMISNYFKFRLQYTAAEDCTTATGWTEIGAVDSGEIWRLYDNAGLTGSVTQANQISTSTVGAEGLYTEASPTGNNPNPADKDTSQVSEWDWPIENNGAVENTSYCFRMIENPSYTFTTYNADSYPKITTTPGSSSLMRHGNFYQNDTKKGFFWAN